MSQREYFKPDKTLPADKHSGGSIMLWGRRADRNGRLHKARGVKKEKLDGGNLVRVVCSSRLILNSWYNLPKPY